MQPPPHAAPSPRAGVMALARGWAPSRDTQLLWTYMQRSFPDDHWLTQARGAGVVMLSEG